MTHSELVDRAAKWLSSRCRCCVVASEPKSQSVIEQPDAIGWNYRGQSTLVECKTTLADFRADARKMFRESPFMGMGRFRYFMTHQQLIDPTTLPPNWGLLEVHGRVVRVIKDAMPVDHHWQSEMVHLIALCRKASGEFQRVNPDD